MSYVDTKVTLCNTGNKTCGKITLFTHHYIITNNSLKTNYLSLQSNKNTEHFADTMVEHVWIHVVRFYNRKRWTVQIIKSVAFWSNEDIVHL